MGSRILVLGGYGNTGRAIARALLERTDVWIVLAGRNRDAALHRAGELNEEFPGERVAGWGVDASDREGLEGALDGIDLVLVASSTPRDLESIARIAIATGTDYLDLWYSPGVQERMLALAPEAEAAGRCLLTQAGLHPGLPALLVRRVAPLFRRLERAYVACYIKADWGNYTFSDATRSELEESPLSWLYRGGSWGEVEHLTAFDFGEFGEEVVCRPWHLGEMERLPQLFPSLQECGFFLYVRHGQVEKPPYHSTLQAVTFGETERGPLGMCTMVSHLDGYRFTALSVVAALEQYLDGSIARPGVWTVGHCLDPDRFLEDLEEMGVDLWVGMGGEDPD